MNLQDSIPTDPGEIDHVIVLLRRDLLPAHRKMVREGTMREYGVAGRLRDALTSLIHQHVTGWRKPRDKSDFANLAADRSIADWIRAAASAVCAIDHLERIANRRAVDGIDPGDDKLEWMPEWAALRASLLEVGLALTYTADEQARAVREGRKKGATAVADAADRRRERIVRLARALLAAGKARRGLAQRIQTNWKQYGWRRADGKAPSERTINEHLKAAGI